MKIVSVQKSRLRKTSDTKYVQDNLFRKMSAEKKINMSSDMFKFAKIINKKYFNKWNRKNYCEK